MVPWDFQGVIPKCRTRIKSNTTRDGTENKAKNNNKKFESGIFPLNISLQFIQVLVLNLINSFFGIMSHEGNISHLYSLVAIRHLLPFECYN